jgi:DNA phosphorothioation-dependent restriction protein DptG
MTSRGFGFVPNWGSSNTAPSRTTREAYFPVSISATVREATFSETLSGIIGASPEHELGDLQEAFSQLSELQGKNEISNELWSAFISGYGVSAGGFGGNDNEPKYIVPFHRSVATTIKIDQRQWWRLYWLLMTDLSEGVDEDLHKCFVASLAEMLPSNLLEQLVIEALNNLNESDTDLEVKESVDMEYHEIPPLVPECAEAFREDLNAWISLKSEESSSKWMLGLRDILSFHYMMYVIQVAVTLDKEYKQVTNGPPYEYTFELQPVPFGLKGETASKSRGFVEAWQGNGISRALYDSWGRLAVLSHIVDLALSPETDIESRPYTLTEALTEFPEDLQQRVVTRLLDEFPEEQRPEEDYNLAEAAPKFSHSVRRYYENMGRTPSAQTAYSAGENSVRDLGKGSERGYIERRQGVGTILRLDRGSLRLFARLFDATKERGHIDEFWEYMRQRGIKFDRRSQQALIQQLEGMGLLQRQSDSGEAMYVDTV